MIYYNSRYADGRVVSIPEEARPIMSGATRFVQRTWPTGITGTYGSYEWRDGDRIDRVASFFLKDPTRWWEIMDINPEIAHPSDIQPGQSIRVPLGLLESLT